MNSKNLIATDFFLKKLTDYFHKKLEAGGLKLFFTDNNIMKISLEGFELEPTYNVEAFQVSLTSLDVSSRKATHTKRIKAMHN